MGGHEGHLKQRCVGSRHLEHLLRVHSEMTSRVIWAVMKLLNEISALESSSSILAPLHTRHHFGLSANPRARHNIN